MPSLPLELILRIFQLASIDEDEECEESSSPAFWSLPLRTQEARWRERLQERRQSWNMAVRFRLVCRGFNNMMASRMRQSAFVTVASSKISMFPCSFDASSLRRFNIHTRQGSHVAVIWQVLRENSKSLESFVVEMVKAPSESRLPFKLPRLGLESVTFPRLTTFTFRTNAASEWFRLQDLILILRAAPQLKHLTVFQLEGPTTEAAARKVWTTRGGAMSQLRSLHIRRMRWMHYEHLRYIVAGSHRSLKKLTLVFESSTSILASNPTMDRGVLLSESVHDAFQPCTEIETLRVADMVHDPAPQTAEYARGRGTRGSSPLSLVMDSLIAGMRKLRRLEIVGPITTPELYDVRRRDGAFPLQSLRIERHPYFRLYQLLYQLRRSDSPLNSLRELSFDAQVRRQVLPGEWDALVRLCHEKSIRLVVTPDHPSPAVSPNDLAARLADLAIQPP